MHGPQELVGVFDIAGIACRVECREPAFWTLLSPRYREFASTATPRLSLRVDVTEPSWERTPEAPPSGPFARIDGTNGRLTIDGAGFQGDFDEGANQGRIAQPLDPSPFETFLTAIYARRLLAEEGFLLHAAAIVGPGGAHVFFGPSGSGKSTVAGLVGRGVITDEVAAIRREGGRYVVFGVPWRGCGLTAPLAALYRLRQAPTTSRRALTPVETTRELLPSVFFPRADREEIDRFLGIAGDLAGTVPGWEMRFARDRTFWEPIAGATLEDGDDHAL